MDTFPAWHADVHDPGQHSRIIAQLRDHGLVTFSGIHDCAGLLAAARPLLTVRPHRDAGTDGVTVISATRDTVAPGYTAFTDAELNPHTDGSSLADPPPLVMLACLQPAAEGGETCVVDGARVLETFADRFPAALRTLAVPGSAFFGAADGHLGSVCAEAGPGRVQIRLRLDELARFSADVTGTLPLLRTVIEESTETFWLHSGEGFLLSNTRWLHGRRRYAGQRVMLRVLSDPLPGTCIEPGFQCPQSGRITPRLPCPQPR
jgi:TfdA family taurine catabolism dioxygenase TauD